MMRRTPRLVLVASSVVLLAGGLWLGSSTPPPSPPPAPTIEPTLPLAIDLRARPAESRSGRSPGFDASIQTDADLDDVTFRLVLPEGLASNAPDLFRGGAVRLGHGDKRAFSVDMTAPRDGVWPIRLEVTYRLADGQTIRTQQGLLWRSGGHAPEGMHHAGAYEWMGVPVAEPQP